MQRIKNNELYDTEHATLIGSHYFDNFKYKETIFQKHNGKYFTEHIFKISIHGIEGIDSLFPVSEKYVRNFVESHCSIEKYLAVFPDLII